MFMLEFGIELPLFTRNRQDRGVAARQAEYEAALATREDLRRQQAARIRADIARWEGFKRQVARDRNALLPLARDRTATALATYRAGAPVRRSEEHTSELQSLMRISYAVFCLQKKKKNHNSKHEY